MEKRNAVARTARVVVKSETADLVRDWIESHPSKNQDEIAIETGFTRSNVLTMIKQGRTKMPLDKIEAFANACDRDPAVLLRTALMEYQPELARLIGRIHGIPMIEQGQEIMDIFTTAMTNVAAEVQAEYKNAASSAEEAQQAGRLSVSLDLSGRKRKELMKMIQSRLVVVKAGGEEVPRFANSAQ